MKDFEDISTYTALQIMAYFIVPLIDALFMSASKIDGSLF